MLYLIEKLDLNHLKNVSDVRYIPYKYTFTEDRAEDFCRGCYKYKIPKEKQVSNTEDVDWISKGIWYNGTGGYLTGTSVSGFSIGNGISGTGSNEENQEKDYEEFPEYSYRLVEKL